MDYTSETGAPRSRACDACAWQTLVAEHDTTAAPAPEPPAEQGRGGGIKSATVGTTVYLLPREHKRVRRLALDMDVPSVHELLLIGLDRLLAERGEPPIERYSPPRPKKG